jgi:hypothetical protein
MTMAREEFEPGQYVRMPAKPDWGLGQVQSVVGNKVTVNFEEAGKVVVLLGAAILEHAED